MTEFEPMWRWHGFFVAILVTALAVTVAVPTVLTVSASTAAGLLAWVATTGAGPGAGGNPPARDGESV